VGGGCVGAWEGGRGKQEVCALGSARGGVSRAKSDSIIDFDAEEKEVDWAGGGRRKAKQSARFASRGKSSQVTYLFLCTLDCGTDAGFQE
jgi:hypothetical protein